MCKIYSLFFRFDEEQRRVRYIKALITFILFISLHVCFSVGNFWIKIFKEHCEKSITILKRVKYFNLTKPNTFDLRLSLKLYELMQILWCQHFLESVIHLKCQLLEPKNIDVKYGNIKISIWHGHDVLLRNLMVENFLQNFEVMLYDPIWVKSHDLKTSNDVQTLIYQFQ